MRYFPLPGIYSLTVKKKYKTAGKGTVPPALKVRIALWEIVFVDIIFVSLPCPITLCNGSRFCTPEYIVIIPIVVRWWYFGLLGIIKPCERLFHRVSYVCRSRDSNDREPVNRRIPMSPGLIFHIFYDSIPYIL